MTKKKKSGSPVRTDHTDSAYMGIRRMLFHNEIAPGQKVSCRDLAKRLGMSPTPVIQALKRLESQGLIRHKPNRGYYTEPMNVQEVREIYETREIIELSLLPETIKTLDEKGIQKLHDALQALLKAPKEIYLNERLLKDMEFHLTLASLSGRKVQVQVLKFLFDLLYLKYRGALLFIHSERVVGSEHKNIFESVASRDLVKAQRAVKQHFKNIKKPVLAALEKILAEKEISSF
ncbi:MAG: GntR family transcriptional regulator [Deltaproteobacteria bacterium]|nr:GntR family transcriptional regulator [Deltaproteobacteria bacterium]MBW2129171.1 GntR family transcriptional regulator [Deltaproteobacteria bacterium]MBW2304178.1 GntR family transcriptional regulator [Deltaproteobacteria bacterium]